MSELGRGLIVSYLALGAILGILWSWGMWAGDAKAGEPPRRIATARAGVAVAFLWPLFLFVLLWEWWDAARAGE